MVDASSSTGMVWLTGSLKPMIQKPLTWSFCRGGVQLYARVVVGVSAVMGMGETLPKLGRSSFFPTNRSWSNVG